MKYKIKNKYLLFFLFSGVINLYGQQELDSIKKEDVVVEFSFDPTLSEVFKLKTTPKIKKEFPKEQISYQIVSKKVISDFVPITKKASYINIDGKKQKYYRNYIYAAAGLYGNGELELILRSEKAKTFQYGLNLFSYNSQNGIDDIRVDNGQWKSGVNLFLGKENKTDGWKTKIDYQRNSVHWYGVNPSVLEVDYTEKDVKQIYNSLELLTDLKFKRSVVAKISPTLNWFSDNFKNTEIDFKVATLLNQEVFTTPITTNVEVAFLSGGFNQDYTTNNSKDYRFVNVGITPSYFYQTEGFQVKIGLGLYLNANLEPSKATFAILPTVLVDLKLIENFMTLHIGNRGVFEQNTYKSLVSKNPFVSPTLSILATKTPLDLFLGLEGRLTKRVSYSTEVNYKKTQDKALFQSNKFEDLVNIAQPFQLGNSFNVLYDDVSVLGVKGNIHIAFTEKLSLGTTALLNTYDVSNETKAWNLPNLEIETLINYKTDRWFAQANVNVVGSRTDLVATKIVDLDTFVDANLKGAYKLNRNLNAHVNIYNLLNNKYESFVNYKVQGIQAVAGLSYRF